MDCLDYTFRRRKGAFEYPHVMGRVGLSPGVHSVEIVPQNFTHFWEPVSFNICRGFYKDVHQYRDAECVWNRKRFVSLSKFMIFLQGY